MSSHRQHYDLKGNFYGVAKETPHVINKLQKADYHIVTDIFRTISNNHKELCDRVWLLFKRIGLKEKWAINMKMDFIGLIPFRRMSESFVGDAITIQVNQS